MAPPLFPVTNPVLDLEPVTAVRDPALLWHEGWFHCWYSAFETRDGNLYFSVDTVRSRNLTDWTAPVRLFSGPANYSSPGNVIRVGDEWVLCFQSYPIPPGQKYGTDGSRLRTSRSRDLVSWSEPRVMTAKGCTASWADNPRQIDPFLYERDGRFYCYYKNLGALGLMESADLETWREISGDHPVLSRADTPDGATVENPSVVRCGDEDWMYFSPCRPGRGIGWARSNDRKTWTDIAYLPFPTLPWAPDGPTAPAVLDLRRELGWAVMAYHGDRTDHFGAALAFAWSRDLVNWESN